MMKGQLSLASDYDDYAISICLICPLLMLDLLNESQGRDLVPYSDAWSDLDNVL